jgi:hypothetical protein
MLISVLYDRLEGFGFHLYVKFKGTLSARTIQEGDFITQKPDIAQIVSQSVALLVES